MNVTETNELVQNPLVKLVSESGLEKTKAQVLLDKFSGFFEIAAEWERTIDALHITDVTQVAEMKMADEGRKFLKAKRVDLEKTRKSLKEDSLREGQTIDAISKVLVNLIEPIEEKAAQKAKFAEIKAAEAKAAKTAERMAKLLPFNVAVQENVIGIMDDGMFESYFSSVEREHNERIAASAKAEAERIAAIEAEKQRQAEIAAENARLKAEAEVKEKELQAERAKVEAERKAAEEKLQEERIEAARLAKIEADKQAVLMQEAKDRAAKYEAEQTAILAQEREKAAKLEAEIKAKADAEAEAERQAELKAAADEKARIAAEKKAKAAPDKIKLAELAKTIAGIELPAVKSEEALQIVRDVQNLLAKTVSHIETKTSDL